ncbi:hypothetical protein SESBI_50279 [Sesbania bispinosa]|nr:hypothetical protein SESBI_50279 [Sesbania bispinosa]
MHSGSRSRKDGDDKDNNSSFYGKPNVNGEYLKAFRTKSYVEICNKAQGQLRKTTRLSSPSSSFVYLTESLLEPQQEIITNITENLKVHHLLVEYFEASLEACRCCDTILECIRQTRLAYGRVTNVVKLSETDQSHHKAMINRELASFVLQNNPFSIISPFQFRDIHDRYLLLFNRLNSKRRKIRRLTIKRVCKKVGAIGLVISQTALLVALLVLAFHSIIGLVAAPCVMSGLLGLMRKRFKLVHERHGVKSSRRLYEQLDVAAKGVYILINDLDTMSRMVKRLDDEVEHWREVADICVKNGKGEILREVVREFHDYESNFLDQLEELEEHIYLCFLTINRSRRLVMQEITEERS